MNFRNSLVGLALGAIVLIAGNANCRAETFEIDQLIDLSAMTPEEVYRFDPDYLWIEPGDSIRFLNSTGNHTVTSFEGIWPDGVEAVNIEHKAQADVRFEKPGVYGFRCKVHGRHGMYALIIVGTPEPNIGEIEYTKVSKLGRRVFERLFEKMKADIEKRQ